MPKVLFKLSMVGLLVVSVFLVIAGWHYGGPQVAILTFLGGILFHGVLLQLLARTKISSTEKSGIPFPKYPEPGEEFLHQGVRYSYTGSWYKRNGEIVECVDGQASEPVVHCDNCQHNCLGSDGELGSECDECTPTELQNFKQIE